MNFVLQPWQLLLAILRDRSGSECLGGRVTSLGGAWRSRQRTGAKERPFPVRDAGKRPRSVGPEHATSIGLGADVDVTAGD
jgi:hypothetical protein